MGKSIGHSIYVFDDFRLDRSKLMLYRGESELPLPPKVIKTLVVLVENHDEILPKEELIEMVWDDSVVEESNLSQYLYLLRKTLGKKPDGGEYIETLRRRGYRFNGPVDLIKQSTTTNGAETKERVVSSEYLVRKEGNVLRLLERSLPAIETKPAEPSVITNAPPKRNLFRWVALFAVLAAIAVALTAGYRFWSAGKISSERKELAVGRLTNTDYVHDAVISRDGRFLAYNEPLDETSRVWVQQIGGSGKVEIIPGGKFRICCKTFSPDGKYLYFNGLDKDGVNALYRVAALGGPPQKINANVGSWVSFSPDGSEILFIRNSDGPKTRSVIIASALGDGPEREVLATNAEFDPYVAAWSRDGNKVAFAAFGSTNTSIDGTHLFVLDLSTGISKQISGETWSSSYRIEWLADDSGLALIGTRTGEGLTAGRDQVFMVTYPEGKSIRLTTDGSRHEPESLSVTDDGAIVAVSFNRSSQVWSMDAGGNSQTVVKLTTGSGEGRGGMASLPDGRVGYLAKEDDGISLWIMGADGSGKKQLLPAGNIEQLATTVNGKYFIFAGAEGDRFNIFRVNTEGFEKTRLTFEKSNNGYMSVSPDGKWLAYDSSFNKDSKLVAAIKRIPISGGDPETLIDDGCRSPEYSPDGRYLACSNFSTGKIAIRSAENGALIREFETPKYSPLEPRWSPDGSSLVYLVQQNNVCNLWKQPVGGGPPAPFTDFTSGKCHALVYSRDGSRIYLARGYELRDAIMIKNYK